MKKQEQKKNRKNLIIGLGIGLGAAVVATSVAAAIIWTRGNGSYEDSSKQSVTTTTPTVQASDFGLGQIELNFSEIPSDSKFDLTLVNDPSNKINVKFVSENATYVVNSNKKSIVNIEFVDVPDIDLVSKFTLYVSYTSKDGKLRSFTLDNLSLAYKYNGYEYIDMLKFDPSTTEQAPEMFAESDQQVTDLYFEAVTKNPNIFFKDITIHNDVMFLDTVKSFGKQIELMKFNEYRVYFTDFVIEKEVTTNGNNYFLSFKFERKMELNILVGSFSITNVGEYTHVPFKVKSNNPVLDPSILGMLKIDLELPTSPIEEDIERIWSIEPDETTWDNTKSRVNGFRFSDSTSEPEVFDEAKTYEEYKSQYKGKQWCFENTSDIAFTGVFAGTIFKSYVDQKNKVRSDHAIYKTYLSKVIPPKNDMQFSIDSTLESTFEYSSKNKNYIVKKDAAVNNYYLCFYKFAGEDTQVSFTLTDKPYGEAEAKVIGSSTATINSETTNQMILITNPENMPADGKVYLHVQKN